jgi:hypothetical protein
VRHQLASITLLVSATLPLTGLIVRPIERNRQVRVCHLHFPNQILHVPHQAAPLEQVQLPRLPFRLVPLDFPRRSGGLGIGARLNLG